MSTRFFSIQDQLAQLTAEVIAESFAIQDREREARARARARANSGAVHPYPARQTVTRSPRYYNIADTDVSYLDLNDSMPEPVESKAAVGVNDSNSNISQASIKTSPTLIKKMKKVFINTPKKLFRQVVAPGSHDSFATVTTSLEATKGPANKKPDERKRRRSLPWSSKAPEL
ncbi:uncharacterized protein N7483_005773 [Penicillium malachiteum]|uniref:uncharacterized protein n=1 Tax=Penicillium malachiteum TaxID=1324776 RepID=UPI0025475536|nr:uncharacterized protein N7483_005773 [Penicillium malachiteum]KAJ5731265.1 hypothetical protein N7483_005773 [Penicillium malachiteum]